MRALGLRLVILLVLLTGLSVLVAGCGGSEATTNSQELSTAGGTVALGDDVTVHFPPGTLSGPTTVTITRASDENAPPQALEAADAIGDAFEIDIGDQELDGPVTIEFPYAEDALPDGTGYDEIFLAYFDDELDVWVPVAGEVDPERNIIAVQTDHLSWWNPWTWNWDAWMAVLNQTLMLRVTDFFDAVAVLVDDCPQSGVTVTVDASDANTVVQGCVERDDPDRPELRVVNPKSFFFEVSSNQFEPYLLSPAESYRFFANTADSPPLVVSAEVSQAAGYHLLMHLLLQMVPGGSEVLGQNGVVSCLVQPLSEVAPIVSAVEELWVHRDGAAAAEELLLLFADISATEAFISAADDCGVAAASTWSPAGFSKLRTGSVATATILSAMDFVANFLLNSHSEVAFNWTPPTPTPTPTPTPKRPTTSGELQAALIRLTDLPVGWALAQPSPGDDSATNPCGRPGSLHPEPIALAEVSYERSGYGPGLIHTVEAFPPGTGAEVMESVRQMSSCTFQDGFYDITVTLSPISFSQLGDETLAVRFHYANQYFSLGDADVVAIRRGDVISAIVFVSDPIDSTQTALFARLAERKLDAVLQ